MAPAARAAHLMEPYSPQIRRNRAIQIGHVREEISTVFAHELDSAGTGSQRLLDAVLIASTFNAWQMARDELALSIEEALDIMIQTVTALLVAARPAGGRS
jgi:hypothetical protein